jgi:O-antigen/teichoic acid export membrane protein
LRSGFAWTLVGNAFYAASQWATLSLIAKLGSAAMLGEYALATSVASPVCMLGHLNLRSVLATDIEHKYAFGDYLRLRLIVSAATVALVAVAGIAAPRVWAATTLMGIAFSIENISDLYYGAQQRRERLDVIAKSMIGRGALSVALVAIALWSSGLLAAVAVMIAARLVLLFLYDRRPTVAHEEPPPAGHSGVYELFRSALPLGLVLMLVSLNANLPRYAVEHYFGARELGAYVATASFITVGTTATNALGQSAVSRLARHFTAGQFDRFRHLAARMIGVPLALGAAGVVIAAAFGEQALAFVYRKEFAAYKGLLIAMMAAGTVVYIGSTVGYLVTSVRAFAIQLPLFALAALVCGVVSWTAPPVIGLYGGALALAVSAATQIAGNVFILRRAIRHRKRRTP